MRLRYSLTDPAKITATLELTMTIGEFEALKKQLADANLRGWPSMTLSTALSDVIRRAHASFASESFDPPRPSPEIQKISSELEKAITR